MTQQAVRNSFSGFGEAAVTQQAVRSSFCGFWVEVVTQLAARSSFWGLRGGSCEAAGCEKQLLGWEL